MTYAWIDYISLLGPTVVALIAAIIVVVGWFVNGRKALSNEIEKEARKYKIELCLSIMAFHERFSELISTHSRVIADDYKLIELCDEMKSKILLYGGSKEYVLLKDLVDNFRIATENLGKNNIEEGTAHYEISSATNQLLGLSQRKLRKELHLEKPVKIGKALKSEAKI